MTNYVLPPDNTRPIILNSGDTLTVKAHGTSHDITILSGATETVGGGGKSDHTTINDGGVETVNGGTADFTTINGGLLALFGGIANHTTVNELGSEVDVREGAVINDPLIRNGIVHADLTSTIDNVTFERDARKLTDAAVGLDNPLALKGTISGFHVGDAIVFADRTHVTGFSVMNNKVTITFDEPDVKQHVVTYEFKNTEQNTQFKLAQVDGNSEIILTHIVGVHDAGHFM